MMATGVHGRDLAPIVALARSIANSELADRLKAGTSHERLAVQKDLEWDVPHVLVTQLPDGDFLCELWGKPDADHIVIRHQCSAPEAEKVVFDLIAKLLSLEDRHGDDS
jgi:hypothetical protein